jgi:hypothetical protein
MLKSRFLAVVPVVLALLPVFGNSAAYAGATTGQKRWAEQVPARQAATYNIEFAGGQTAEFAIVGDADTDVDIFVYDQNGNLVTQDIGLSDLGLVRWTPGSTQTYPSRSRTSAACGTWYAWATTKEPNHGKHGKHGKKSSLLFRAFRVFRGFFAGKAPR